jgi:hypothetical protein
MFSKRFGFGKGGASILTQAGGDSGWALAMASGGPVPVNPLQLPWAGI